MRMRSFTGAELECFWLDEWSEFNGFLRSLQAIDDAWFRPTKAHK